MRRINAFSLIELLVVVVLVGILAVMALPNFTRGAERARIRDAEAVLAAIHSAERVYYLDQNGYGRVAPLAPLDPTQDDLIRLGYLSNPDAGDTNKDWNFAAVLTGGGSGFNGTATRTGVSMWNGNTIFINQNFNGENYVCTGYDAALCP